MQKPKVVVLGSTGMVGHLISLYLLEKDLEVVGISRSKLDVDNLLQISANFNDLDELTNNIENINPDILINCVGVLNEAASKNKIESIRINALLPQLLAYRFQKKGPKLIQISTDCVFSGENHPYNEMIQPDGKGEYAWTKILGEVDNNKDLTIRTSIVGPDIKKDGIGLFNWYLDNKDLDIIGYSKVYWTGVTNLQLAQFIYKSFHSNRTGIIHLVNNERITKYDLLKLFNKYFNSNKSIIISDDKKNTSKVLINTKDVEDLKINSYEDMMVDLKEWVKNHEKIYKNLNIRL